MFRINKEEFNYFDPDDLILQSLNIKCDPNDGFFTVTVKDHTYQGHVEVFYPFKYLPTLISWLEARLEEVEDEWIT